MKETKLSKARKRRMECFDFRYKPIFPKIKMLMLSPPKYLI